MVRERNFIRPDEMPYDQGLIFQDGRPLLYDSGDYPASLEKLKELVGWDEFEAFRGSAGPRAGGSASGWPATSRAPASARTRVRTCGWRPPARGGRPTGLTTQGQGHETVFAQIAAESWACPWRTSRGHR